MSIAFPPTPLRSAAAPGAAAWWVRARHRWLTADLALAVALVLVTGALYARTAGFGFVDYDDGAYVGGNGHLAMGLTPAGVRWALTAHKPYWHPVPWICYLALAQCFGPSAGPVHVFNTLTHAASAGLLFLFWRRATGMRWASVVAAALWAWHPLRVESVAWVSETKDVLGCFFWTATLWLYAGYARRPSRQRYLAVSAAFLLSLASKPTVVTLPAVLLLLDYWPLQRFSAGGAFKKLVLEKLPWVLLAGAVAAVAYWAQRDVGALKLDLTFLLPVRLANAVTAYVAYVRQTVWPRGLAIFYPYPNTIGQPVPDWAWGGAAALLLAISIAAVAVRRRAPAVFVGWFWFAGSMLPMIGLVQAGLQARADRHTLIPSIGLTAMVVWPVAGWVGRSPRSRLIPVVSLAILVALVECALSVVQIGTWRSSTTVFAHAVAVTQDNYLAEGGLAVEYAAAPGTRAEALRLARASVKACPHVVFGYNALGIVHESMGELPKALAAFTVCSRLEPKQAAAWEHLGNVNVKLNQYAPAEADFHTALQLEPTNFAARNNLAICLAHDGQMDQAIAQWQRVVRECPQMGESQGWLADALRLQGDRIGAVAHYRRALAAGERRPTWQYNFAWLVATDPNASTADVEQALPAARDAVEQTGGNDPLALDALAAACARSGQFDQAVHFARQGSSLATTAHQSSLAQAMQRRVDLYTSGQPFVVGR